MIIKYEIENFIKEIESKLPSLSGKAHEKALEKIAVLNRVNIEFMEYENLMRKVTKMNSEAQVDALKLMKRVQVLEEEVKHLKSNING